MNFKVTNQFFNLVKIMSQYLLYHLINLRVSDSQVFAKNLKINNIFYYYFSYKKTKLKLFMSFELIKHKTFSV